MEPLFSTRFDLFIDDFIKNQVLPLNAVDNHNDRIREVLLENEDYSIPTLSMDRPNIYPYDLKFRICIDFRGCGLWFKAKPINVLISQYDGMTEDNQLIIQFESHPDKFEEIAGDIYGEIVVALKDLKTNLQEYLDEHYP